MTRQDFDDVEKEDVKELLLLHPQILISEELVQPSGQAFHEAAM